LLALLLLASGNAAAGTVSAPMRVTATVVQPCTELAIDASERVGSSVAEPPPTLSVTCSRGRSYAVEVSRATLIEQRAGTPGTRRPGSHRFEVLLVSGGNVLPAVPATGAAQTYALPLAGEETAEIGLDGSVVVSVTF
jgi:hypothetical protein